MTQDRSPGQRQRLRSRSGEEIHPEHPVLQISVVAAMVGVHQQTLRSYERIGLVTPARSSGNTRLYSFADVERVRQVLRLVEELGVNHLLLNLQAENLDATLARMDGFASKVCPLT